jgi:type II secretory ATPase GspE/PulE/Tfp pilus assembly ATPase PilB-like protein
LRALHRRLQGAARPPRADDRLGPVKALIQERARVANLLATALDEGMRTLRQDGIEKVLAGLTDLKQVRKVCIR